MNIGKQLIAPAGYGPLTDARTYYFLASQARLSRTLLVWFVPTKPGRPANGLVARPYMLAMDRDEFEGGLLSKAIRELQVQSALPPWLSGIDDRQLARSDRSAANAQCVERRLRAIGAAVDRYEEILHASDPIASLNRYAQASGAHRMRFRTWFLAYVLFGFDDAALLPTFHRIGRWERNTQTAGNRPFGRPTKRRAVLKAPRLSEKDRTLIVDSYRRYRRLGAHLSKIHIAALRRDWGCKVAKRSDGGFEIYQPEGQPFPTYRQYEYQLLKTIGRRQLQIDRRGPEWVRNKLAMSRGRYAQHAANLLERVESDGYWSNSHPSDLAGNPLPRVVTVKLIDTVSGAQFGVGFSLGGEAAAAYAAACFCAAIGLRRYLQLFGLDVGAFEVPSPGLMATLITDRGPGSGAVLAEQVPFRELSPAYSGQSKSVVEASHPRCDQNAEAPSYPVSRLSPVGLARQELWRAVQHNHNSDASARLTPEMAAVNVAANPMAIWSYLEERGRKAGRSMQFENAVRTFLKPVSFRIDRNGLTLNHLRFSLAAGDEDVLSAEAGAGQIDGYCLPMCLRHAWINLKGRLYQVDAQLPFCDDSGQLHMSLTELQAHGQRISAAKATQIENKRAVRLYADIEFEKQLGAEFDQTQRRSGRARVRRSVKHEPLR